MGMWSYRMRVSAPKLAATPTSTASGSAIATVGVMPCCKRAYMCWGVEDSHAEHDFVGCCRPLSGTTSYVSCVRFAGKGFIVPPCPNCGGILKPDVVFFGDGVPPARSKR